jgi:hypothetical protein
MKTSWLFAAAALLLPTAGPASVSLQIRGTLKDVSGPSLVIRTERSLVVVPKERLSEAQRAEMSTAGAAVTLLLTPEQIESVRPLPAAAKTPRRAR